MAGIMVTGTAEARRAVAFCVGWDKGASNYHFGQYDTALRHLIAINRGAYASAVANGRGALTARLPGAAGALVAAVALTTLGLRPRLAEFRSTGRRSSRCRQALAPARRDGAKNPARSPSGCSPGMSARAGVPRGAGHVWEGTKHDGTRWTSRRRGQRIAAEPCRLAPGGGRGSASRRRARGGVGMDPAGW